MSTITFEAVCCAIRAGGNAPRSSRFPAGRAAWVLAAVLSFAACCAHAAPGDLLRTFPNPAPAAGDCFGGSLAAVGNNVLVGAYRDDLTGEDAGTAYLLNGSTGTVIRTFQDPPHTSGDLFGRGVAAVGANILVGADCDDTANYDAGAAYLFDGTTGNRLQTFLPPTAGNSEHFAYSVAGMGNNVLVGAFCESSLAYRAGAVYLFNGSTGALALTIPNPNPASGDMFGRDVAVLGNNILVGAYHDNGGVADSGAAYLFNGTTGQLLQTFTSPRPAAGDMFGISVKALGNNVLVACCNDDTGATDAGAVYLFDGATGHLLRTFANPAPAVGDRFGICVAAVGNNVLVGADLDDAGAVDSGAAYLFDGATGNLLQTYLNPTPSAGDWFGVTVAALGSDVLVGSQYDRSGSSDVGAVYLFQGVPEPASLALLAAGALALLRRRGR
jgi:hypothetical protein